MPVSKPFDPNPRPRKPIGALLRERVGVFYVEHIFNRRINLEPRSPDPYSTHLPILCALAAAIRPARIVEYGSGLISTATFLDRTVFPKVISLLSFENNREWHSKVASQIGHDSRLQYRLVEGGMMDAVRRDDVSAADLIFVDDEDFMPPNLPRRADTIAAIAALRPSCIPVVIHDIELWRFHKSSRCFDHMFRFDALHPQTGVAWNGSWNMAGRLPAINRLIRNNYAAVPHRDVERWTTVFCDGLRLVRPS